MYKLNLTHTISGFLVASMIGPTIENTIEQMKGFLYSSSAVNTINYASGFIIILYQDGVMKHSCGHDTAKGALDKIANQLLYPKDNNQMKYLAMFFSNTYTYQSSLFFESFDEAIRTITGNADDYFTCVPTESETGVTILTQRLNRMVHIIRMSPTKVETITKYKERPPLTKDSTALLSKEQLEAIGTFFHNAAKIREHCGYAVWDDLCTWYIEKTIRENESDSEDC